MKTITCDCGYVQRIKKEKAVYRSCTKCGKKFPVKPTFRQRLRAAITAFQSGRVPGVRDKTTIGNNPAQGTEPGGASL